MARREVIEKPLYRFTVVDHNIHTWAVFDRIKGRKVIGEDGLVVEYRDSMTARQVSEDYNINGLPEVLEATNP
jgi:hypothetical protein